MHAKIPERIVWAVEVLDLQPDDVILEVGCGRGFAIGPICSKLTTGHITAIDRSEKMVRIAAETNAVFVDSGKVSIIKTDLLSSNLAHQSFDKIFVFNLNVFWMDPIDELGEIRRLLKPKGAFYIFHQPPPGHDVKEFAREFRNNLVKNDFSNIEVLFKDLVDATRLTCVISQPA